MEPENPGDKPSNHCGNSQQEDILSGYPPKEQAINGYEISPDGKSHKSIKQTGPKVFM